MRDYLAGLDWALLRRQKAWLLSQDGDEAAGLVYLLDGLQDLAVADYGYAEETVFGPSQDEPAA